MARYEGDWVQRMLDQRWLARTEEGDSVGDSKSRSALGLAARCEGLFSVSDIEDGGFRIPGLSGAWKDGTATRDFTVDHGKGRKEGAASWLAAAGVTRDRRTRSISDPGALYEGGMSTRLNSVASEGDWGSLSGICVVGVMVAEGGGGRAGLWDEGLTVVGGKRGGLVVAAVACHVLCTKKAHHPYGDFGSTKIMLLKSLEQGSMGGCYILSVGGWNWGVGVIRLELEGRGKIWDVGWIWRRWMWPNEMVAGRGIRESGGPLGPPWV